MLNAPDFWITLLLIFIYALYEYKKTSTVIESFVYALWLTSVVFYFVFEVFLIIKLVPEILEKNMLENGFIDAIWFLAIPIIGYVFSVFLAILIPLGLLAVIGIAFTKTKRIENGYMYVVFVFNLFILILCSYGFYSCQIDEFCREADPPLGNGRAWIIAYAVGNILLTYPVVKFLDSRDMAFRLK